jgi:hypothetical protein
MERETALRDVVEPTDKVGAGRAGASTNWT